jgi:hypothetical protein
MQTILLEDAIAQKTQELCQAILDDAQVQTMRQRIDRFLANEAVRGQYDVLMMKGEALQYKQNLNLPMDEAEIKEFETLRDELMENVTAREFMQAQRQMHKVQEGPPARGHRIRLLRQRLRLPLKPPLTGTGNGVQRWTPFAFGNRLAGGAVQRPPPRRRYSEGRQPIHFLNVVEKAKGF